jgi:hypothetical protein
LICFQQMVLNQSSPESVHRLAGWEIVRQHPPLAEGRARYNSAWSISRRLWTAFRPRPFFGSSGNGGGEDGIHQGKASERGKLRERK